MAATNLLAVMCTSFKQKILINSTKDPVERMIKDHLIFEIIQEMINHAAVQVI